MYLVVISISMIDDIWMIETLNSNQSLHLNHLTSDKIAVQMDQDIIFKRQFRAVKCKAINEMNCGLIYSVQYLIVITFTQFRQAVDCTQ